MTRRHEMMLEDLFGCSHEAETPIASEDGQGIDHWICRCGRRVATGQRETKIDPSDDK